MLAGICTIFLMGTIDYNLSHPGPNPNPLDTINLNINEGKGKVVDNFYELGKADTTNINLNIPDETQDDIQGNRQKGISDYQGIQGIQGNRWKEMSDYQGIQGNKRKEMSDYQGIQGNQGNRGKEISDYQDGCVKEDNIAYWGQSFASRITNNGERQCANWCGKRDNCKFYVFQKRNNLCLLKPHNIDRRNNRSYISGSKACAKNEAPQTAFTSFIPPGVTSCLTDNYYNYGNFFISGEDNHQPTILHCQKQCAAHFNCTLWTYGKEGGRYARQCYLKDSASGDERYDPALIEGQKNCIPNVNDGKQFNPNTGISSCLTDNYYNYGNIFLSGEENHQPTILHCQKQCATHLNCSLWTYGKKGGRYAQQCYLKHSASGDERYDPALIEGPKNCIPNMYDDKQFNPIMITNTGINSCLTDNYYNYGNFFISGEDNHQPTIFHCQKQCATHLNCTLWTYGKKGGRYARQCYLKHSASGEERYDPGLIEGPKNCTPNMNYAMQVKPIVTTNTGECDGKLCGFSPCTTDSGRGGICNGRGGCVQTITNPCSKPNCKLCIR